MTQARISPEGTSLGTKAPEYCEDALADERQLFHLAADPLYPELFSGEGPREMKRVCRSEQATFRSRRFKDGGSLKSIRREQNPKIVSCFDVPLLHSPQAGNSKFSGIIPRGKQALGGT